MHQTPSPTMKIFASAVKHELETQSMTKSELARKAGIELSRLRKILNLRGGNCAFSTADQIASALGTTVPTLLSTEA